MKKINKKLFKKAVGSFITGVTVIGIKSKEKYIGKTINSFSSLSLEPPLILFSIDKKSSSIRKFKKNIFLSVNILNSKQEFISKRFSEKESDWNSIKFKESKNNTPIINNCLSNIDCKIIEIIPKGDHKIIICKVLEASFNKEKKPLIYFNSTYHKNNSGK